MIEVLVTMAIFSLVMTMVVAIYVRGVGYHRALAAVEANFINAEMAFVRISRDLMCDAETILYPAGDEGASIVFASFATDLISSSTIGYIFDVQQQYIKRVIYSQFDPDSEESCIVSPVAGNPRVIARGVNDVKYTLIGNGLMHIFMTSQGADKEYLFETLVKTR